MLPIIQSACLIITFEVSIDDHIVVAAIGCHAAILQARHDLKRPESQEQTQKLKAKAGALTVLKQELLMSKHSQHVAIF